MRRFDTRTHTRTHTRLFSLVWLEKVCQIDSHALKRLFSLVWLEKVCQIDSHALKRLFSLVQAGRHDESTHAHIHARTHACSVWFKPAGMTNRHTHSYTHAHMPVQFGSSLKVRQIDTHTHTHTHIHARTHAWSVWFKPKSVSRERESLLELKSWKK